MINTLLSVLALVAFLLAGALTFYERWRHNRARDAEITHALSHTSSAGVSWYENDRVLRRMMANQLGFLRTVVLWCLGLVAAGGFLLLISWQPGPDCCRSAPSSLAIVLCVAGVSGTLWFCASLLDRRTETKTAAQLHTLAAGLPATATSMWMALFTWPETGPGGNVNHLPFAVLWPTVPEVNAHPALCVRLVNVHRSSCPDSGWSKPEPVAVLGQPTPGEWIVIRRPDGAALWPAERASGNNYKWRWIYKQNYRRFRRQVRRKQRQQRRKEPDRTMM